MASTPNSVNAINALCDTRQRIPAMLRIRWVNDLIQNVPDPALVAEIKNMIQTVTKW
jgi:hypothetical protein